MAKNNVNGDPFLKTNEVVFLPDNGKQEPKKCTGTPRRRTQSAYQVTRPSIETPKFSSSAVKVTNMSKAVQVLPITCSVVPVQAGPSTSKNVSEIAGPSGFMSSSMPGASPVQRINRNSQTFGKRASLEVVYEKPGKIMTPASGVKREIKPNGQISPMAVGRKRSIPLGLTITPIVENATKSSMTTDSQAVMCKAAQACSSLSAQSSFKNTEPNEKDTPTRILAKSVFPKDVFYGNKTTETPTVIKTDANFRRSAVGKTTPPQEQQPQQTTPPVQAPTRGRPRGSRNKVYEPVCLTISSDDEEPNDQLTETIQNGTSSILLRSSTPSGSSPAPRNKSAVNTSVNKSPSEHFPKGKSMMMEVEEDEEDAAEEMVEDEEEMEVEEEEEEQDSQSENLNNSVELFPTEALISPAIVGKQLQILCRSIRVGSYKIHPQDDNLHVIIFLSADGFRFQVPTTKNMRDLVNITITAQDIQQVLGHFGRCLPILFIFNTTACGERLRRQLHMLPDDVMFFDPDGEDDRQKIITFLIDIISEEHRSFMRHLFPSETVLKEVDQKLANEILVKSTPQHNQQPPLDGEIITNAVISNVVISNAVVTNAVVTNAVLNNAVINATVLNSAVAGNAIVRNASNSPANFVVPPSVTIVQTTAPASLIIQSPMLRITEAPVTKLLTYPPPPQSGGIAITSADISCLDEGEFLNDAIIDFYLKYLMNEILSESDRQRTHIFSSFFYPRLTHKSSVRLRSGEDASCQSSVKRHAQVRSWTKNIDIFEKDYIIIPINQNVHWFLAVICYPWLVPDGVSAESTSAGKSSDDVTSSNDGELEESGISSPQLDSNDETKDPANSIDDQSSDDASSNEMNSAEEPNPEGPDSSTHPDKNVRRDKMPCILIFDSLSGPSRWRIVATLRDYLDMEWKIKRGTPRDFTKTTIKGFVPGVPQQSNFSDCGVYVLQYVETFFENKIPYFGNVMPQLLDWFPPERVNNKREEVRNLIMRIHNEQVSSSASSSTSSQGSIAKKDVEKAVCSTTTSVPLVQNPRSLS